MRYWLSGFAVTGASTYTYCISPPSKPEDIFKQWKKRQEKMAENIVFKIISFERDIFVSLERKIDKRRAAIEAPRTSVKAAHEKVVNFRRILDCFENNKVNDDDQYWDLKCEREMATNAALGELVQGFVVKAGNKKNAKEKNY